MEIGSGTTALRGEGNPLQALELQPVDDRPAPRTDCHVIGLAFDLGPDGATFVPPLILTFEYDPASCPKGVDEEDLVIAYFDVLRQEWVPLESTVDTENNTITAEVSGFTYFAILVKPAAVISWWLVASIIAAVVVIAFAAIFLVARRRGAPANWIKSWNRAT